MIVLPRVIVFLVFITLHVIVPGSYGIAKQEADSKVIICTYQAYADSSLEGGYSPEEIDPYLCTHLVYAFGIPDAKSGFLPADAEVDLERGGYKRINDLKVKNQNLKTLINSGTDPKGNQNFKEIYSNPDDRKEFAKNAAKFLKQYNFDGVLISWYGLKSEEERKNFSALFKEMKDTFERFATEMKIPRYVISLQIIDGIEDLDIEYYDFSEINKYVDFIMMHPHDSNASHKNALTLVAPLYSLTDSANDKYTVDYVTSYILKKGADPNKVIINIPSFGNLYKIFNDTRIGSPAVEVSSLLNWLPYFDICEKLKNNNTWKLVYPKIGYSGPYAYRGNAWFSFDDPDMVALKARYVNKKGLRGISFFSIGMDDFRGNCFGKKYPIISIARSTLFNISYGVPLGTNANQTSFGIGLSEAQEKDKRANGCELPSGKVLKMEYEVICPQDDSLNYCKLSREGSVVSQYTKLSYSCYDEHVLDSSETSSICLNKKWVPTLTPCKKTCRNLRPLNLNLKCGYKGKLVDCNGVMNPGTTVLPRCSPGYRTPLVPEYETIKCQDDGEWDDVLFKCVPACGHVAVKSVTPLVHGGRIAKYGEFPWHVGIYDKTSRNQLICGGTIISSLLVVSAAHCFSNRRTGEMKNADNYEVAVGKYSVNRTINDSQFTKFFLVKRIHFNDYHGEEFRFENDIAILELTTRITFNDFVLPACVYLQTTAIPEILSGEVLMTAGWGIEETGRQSQTLKVASLPFVNTRDCLNKATAKITDYLSRDKFCAGNHSGEAVDQGDSGGGLMYKDPQTKLFYLYGIVSYKDINASPIAIFTNVANHANWLKNKKDSIQKSIP